jgi:hypothetical protein
VFIVITRVHRHHPCSSSSPVFIVITGLDPVIYRGTLRR